MVRRFTKRLALLLFLSTSFSTCISTDTLTQNQPLVDGQTLVSTNGSFALGFFTPRPGSTNRYVGVWFNNISVQTVVWVANRQNPINNSTGSLAISSNGSLIITIQNSTINLSAAMTNLRNPIAQLLDDGNFVVREEDSSGTVDSFAWQSFDYPTDTLLPGMKLGWNLTTGLNRNLTSWSSDTDPSPGPYSLTFNLHGDPQLFLMDGTRQFWRVGPWNGLRLVGLPEMDGKVPFNFSFVDDPDEVYYTYHKLDPSVTVRLIVNNTGLVQRQVWIEQNKLWNIFWQGPDSECDQISSCGPYGMCNENNSPVCSCLPGFDPKSPVNWALRDGRDGCVRKTALDCRNRTDGFETVSGAKLPDTTNATVNMSMSLDACKAKCLSNCSCTAYASANVQGGGSGCVIWTTELTDISIYQTAGQDLYVRLAAADLESLSGHSHSRAAVAIVLSIIAGITILACIGCCIWRRKKKKRTNALFGNIPLSDHYTNDGAEGNDLEMPLFNFDTVAAATDNFSIDNKLGQGGFGPVYKGVLGDGQEIAVKRLAKTSIQGCDEFKNEVVLIAKLQHRNLVRLLGCCIHREERMLIYEYMPNKSLDVYLFDKARRALLDWQTRIHIILGIARGVVYLHQDSRLRIIHRDLKASNILLDGEMNPKISDFGMARIFGGDETQVNTRKVVGTFGYMAPEYAMDGIFSVKSDVFSFGVLILEIISGKKNRGVYLSDPNINLLGLAWSLWKEGNGLQLVDEAVGISFPMSEALRCIKVGLLCVQERPEQRPSMSSVVLMLGSDNASLPTPKEPGFVSMRGHTEGDSSTSKQDSSSANDMTVTVFEGR